MTLNLLNLTFIAYILSQLYVHTISGFMGVDVLAVSLFAFLLVHRAVNPRVVAWLGGVYLVAVIATAVAIFRYPPIMSEAVKSLFSFATALFSCYVAFLLVELMTARSISSICFWMAAALLILSAAEVALPPVRRISERIASTQFATTEAVNTHTQRDELLHGGIPRPLLGTQEPSWVGIILGFVISGWNLTTLPSPMKNWIFAAFCGLGLAITRSPSFLMVLIAGNIVYFLRIIRSNQSTAIATILLLAVGTVTAGYLMRDRISGISQGEDASFTERVMLPISLTTEILSETYGMGVGFVGNIAEPGNRALDPLFPSVVKAIDRANADRVLDLYNEQGKHISVGLLPSMTHWVYHGILFGIASLFCWVQVVRNLTPGLVAAFFITFIPLGTVGFGYESLRLWIMQLMILGFLKHWQDIDAEVQWQRHGFPHANSPDGAI